MIGLVYICTREPRFLSSPAVTRMAGLAAFGSPGRRILERFKQGIASANVETTAATSAPTNTAFVADQIRQLGELRDQGLVTPDEFETKKSELLQRM